MDYVIIFCLAVMVAIFAGTIYKIFSLKRAARIEYIRDYKKGRFVYVYIVALPLFYLAYYFNGALFWDTVMGAIRSSMDLVVLKFNLEATSALMEANALYNIAIAGCFILVVLNVLMFTFAVFGYNILNYFTVRFICRFAKTINIITGLNAQNMQLLSTINRREQGHCLLFCRSQKELDDALSAGVFGRVKFQLSGDLAERILGLIRHIPRRRINIFINTGEDKINLIYVKQAAALAEKLALKASTDIAGAGFNVYAFGNPENENAFIHFMEKTTGAVRYINKYKLIAFDFCEQYPLTQFMTEQHINHDSAEIRGDIDINTVFIGFGHTNRQLFLTFIANNQFLTRRESGAEALPVNYFIFDKENSENDKNLNHNYFRYQAEKEEIAQNPQGYLPLPEKPAEVMFIKQDINDMGFYRRIKDAVRNKPGRKSFSYVVIAFGTDLENIDLAKKLADKFKEWSNDSPRIFVKIKDKRLKEEVVECELFPCDSIIAFGCETESVYSFTKITRGKTELMARMRHLAYAIEYEGLHCAGGNEPDMEKIKQMARYEWYSKWSQVQRDSNIYACMSLRPKLHLIGYDYASVGKAPPEFEQFYQKYTKGYPINYYDREICGKKAVRYNNNDAEIPSLRRTYAMLEHQRWNAYMIASGFIPSSIAEISQPDRGKKYSLRKHGNITTFEGLKQFRRIIAEINGLTEEQTDVIRYDYQLMDDAVWLLKGCGYDIIKKPIADG